MREIFNILSHFDGSVQERRNSIVNALELRLSCTKPSIWGDLFKITLSATLSKLWFDWKSSLVAGIQAFSSSLGHISYMVAVIRGAPVIHSTLIHLTHTCWWPQCDDGRACMLAFTESQPHTPDKSGVYRNTNICTIHQCLILYSCKYGWNWMKLLAAWYAWFSCQKERATCQPLLQEHKLVNSVWYGIYRIMMLDDTM